MAPTSARAPPPPPEAPASPPPPPPPPSPLVTEAHVLRATRTVFDARGVAPSWSDASWLCVSDFGAFGDDADVPARETAWAQVGPWGAFALVSAFRLETDTWNALRFAARVSRPEFRVGWDLIDTQAPQTSGSPVTPSPALEPPPPSETIVSANETSRRFFSRRVRSVDTEPEEEPIRAANSSVSAAFLHKKADGWYEPWNLDPSQTSISFDPSSWREVFVPLDRALFFTGEPKAEVSWNRLSWRDVSGFGGEIQLRDVRLESWARRASIDDDTGEPDTTPDVRTADDENGTSEASRRDRVYVSAPPAPAAPALAVTKTQSQKRGDDASGDASSVVVVPSAPVEVASDARLVLVALFVALFVALAFVAACAVALLSRRAARRGRGGAGEKDEERGGEEKAFGARRRLREGVDSAGVSTRVDSLASPARPFRTSSSSRAPRRRPPPGPRRAASASDADAAFAARDSLPLFASEVFSQQKASAAFAPRREKRRDADDASPSSETRRLGVRVFSEMRNMRKSVSRTPSAQCSAGDSSTGGDFGGVLRGFDQPGVVNITADALALALETTASSVGTLASFESESRRVAETDEGEGSPISETDASDEDITSVDGIVDVTKHSRAFEALTASQFEADVALGAVLGKGASATVRAGTWTRRPSWTTASKPDVEPVPVFEKVAVKLFEPTDRNVDRKGSASFENELRVLRIIGGGKPSRLVAALAACADAGAVPEEEKRKMAENKTFPRVRAILMPLLDGGSLHDALRRAAETENPYETFPLAARLRALTHVASALRYLHDMGADLFASRSGRERDARRTRANPGSQSRVSVAHLDVKPKNVLLDARTQSAKLADFGSAILVTSDLSDQTERFSSRRAVGRAVDDADAADASDVDAAVDAMLDDAFPEETFDFRLSGAFSLTKPPGTINYMAPELFEGATTTPSVDDVCFLAPNASRLTRCDAWSFAMTAYETLTGSVPWRGLTPTQIVELVGVKDERPRGLGDPERITEWLGDDSEKLGRKTRSADASDRERKIFAVTFHEHLVEKCVVKCWARDPHDRPHFAETLARLRRLRRGLANRGLAKASKDAFFFPSARATARRERDDDASYGAAVPRSASSFASASLELSSASE